MRKEKRAYRKSLSSHGFIYLAEHELEISVRNLSITGLLAELDANSFVVDIDSIFHAFESSITIDLYLPEMRLAGDADVVRAEKIESHIYLALEFRSLTFDANNLLYKRKAYRKAVAASGDIVFQGETYRFLTENVSIDGLMVHLKENLNVEVGTVTSYDFSQFALNGKVKVIWIEKEADGSTLMGLQYIDAEISEIKGIPGFLSWR